MHFRKIVMAAALATACIATPAAPQSDKQPIVSDTGRFGDPTSIARKYQGFQYGVLKAKSPDELILTQTKFGVDQSFKLNKKTKFVQDGKASLLGNLKVGDKLYVDADTDKKTGVMTAKKVVSGVDFPVLLSGQ